jgi:hypothetical protein
MDTILPTTTTTASTIRHSGRVYVRGRIRRVWRPRFLELTDDGKLQYYEIITPQQQQRSSLTNATTNSTIPFIPDTNIQSTNVYNTNHPLTNATTNIGSNPNHEYKYTLIVTAARILDVTTIRDLHTGLPRGTFGFVVRGQRQKVVSAFHHHTDVMTSTSTNVSKDNMTESFVFAEENVDDLTDIPIRDYLCAVPTLEDAQMWVVALQWASSISMSLPDTSLSSSPSSLLVGSNRITPSDHWWKVDYNTSSSIHQVPFSITKPNDTLSTGLKEKTKESFGEGDIVPSTKSIQLESKVDATTRNEEIHEGKILVTAVTGYSIIRQTTWTLEVAYDIHAMLLYSNTNSKSSSGKITNQQGDVVSSSTTRCVEQWSMRRTAEQFQNLSSQLFRYRNKCTTTDTTGTKDDTDRNMLLQLPTWINRPTLSNVEQSISVVDSILRSWVLAPDLVNTDEFKQFLGLNSTTATQVLESTTNIGFVRPLLSFFRSTNSTNPFAIIDKVTTTVPNNISSDVYVRDWLQIVRRRNTLNQKDFVSGSMIIGLLSSLLQIHYKPTYNMSQIAIQLRHNQERTLLYVGGAAVAVFGVIPVAIPLWKYIMPVVYIRLDYLFASWAGAVYIGHRVGSSRFMATDNTTNRGQSNNHRNRIISSSATNKLTSAMRPSKTTNVAPVSSTMSLKSISTAEQKAPDSPKATSSQDDSAVMVIDDIDAVRSTEMDDFADYVSTTESHHQHNIITADDDDDYESDGDGTTAISDDFQNPDGANVPYSNKNGNFYDNEFLSSPLPKYPDNNGYSCWSQPSHDIFHVRGVNYFNDKVKVCSGPSPLICRGVDVWITDNPERHIARHPSVLGGQLNKVDTFLVNFLLPFGNLVAYFEIPPLPSFPDKLRTVWSKFLKGDQQYRDARLKLLPVVVDGPWIVKTAVGPGKSPALLGKVIPIQYYFRDPDRNTKGLYEVDVIITASTIAKGILSVVKSQTKTVSIAFAFIIEAAEQSELPETVLCSFQVHSLHLEDCPSLPMCNLD